MLCVIKGYTDTALTVPCCQGEGDVFRDKKKGETASERLSQRQLYLILGQREGSRDEQEMKLIQENRGGMIGGGKP